MADIEEQFCRDRANEIMHLSEKIGKAQARVEKLERALKEYVYLQTGEISSLTTTPQERLILAQQALRNDE